VPDCSLLFPGMSTDANMEDYRIACRENWAGIDCMEQDFVVCSRDSEQQESNMASIMPQKNRTSRLSAVAAKYIMASICCDRISLTVCRHIASNRCWHYNIMEKLREPSVVQPSTQDVNGVAARVNTSLILKSD
jgi:hypothetical protein